MNLWVNRIIFFLFILGMAGCQNLPAVTPTAAEVVDIRITGQPESQQVPSATPIPESTIVTDSPTPVSEAYPAPQPYPVSQAYPGPEAAYPGPGSAYPGLESAYPGSEVTGPTLEPYAFRTSQPGTATLRGFLLVLDPMVLVPGLDDAIYLVPLTDNEGGPSTIPPIERGKVPQADVDERTGEFVFTDIRPGQYAVVIVTTGDSEVPARVYETSNLAIVTIKESDLDKTIDLGHLVL
jgi:hypothetical protein